LVVAGAACDELVAGFAVDEVVAAFGEDPVAAGAAEDLVVAFADALPAIREKVQEHMGLRGLPREDFEYSDVSGIAGSGLTTNFSYPFARSLAERHADCVGIDWEQYQHADR